MRKPHSPIPRFPDGPDPHFEVTAEGIRATRRIFHETQELTLRAGDRRDALALVPDVAGAFGSKHLESRRIADELVRLRDGARASS